MVKRASQGKRWGPLLTAALAVWLAARVARAQQDVPLTIEAPQALTLGVDKQALLRIRAPSPLTASLTTNLGSLSAPEPSGEGEWRVRYTPPDTRYPQVAIVALVGADGAQLAWARIALHGSATVELRSDPQVQVSVKVGERTFGPVSTDARGAAALAVIVPPGVARALSTARDALGNERVESIPLDVPPLTPLLAVCPREDARDFLILAAQPDGAPASGLSLTAEATSVSAGEVSEPEPGVYRAALDIPSGVRAGERARMSASIAGKPDAAVSCELAVPLERPTALRVELSRPRFSASEGEPIRVRVVPEYAGVREKAAFALSFQPDLGELSETRVRAREPVELTWQLPRRIGERSEARLAISGDLRRTLIVPLSAAPLAALELQLSAAWLPADGHGSARLLVRARDAHGNPVRDARLSAQARGVLSELGQRAPGDYEAEYRAPLGQPGEDRIVVRDAVSGLSGATVLELRRPGGRIWLAAHAGYLSNFARVSGPLVQLEAGYRLPVLSERLSLALVLGYYQSSGQVPVAGAEPALSTSLWAFPLLLRAAYTIPIGAFDLAPLLGAGALGAATRVRSAATGTVKDRQLVPLLAAGVAAGLGLGPGRLCLMLGYLHAVLDGDGVQGNAAGVNATLGYELRL